MSTVMNTNRWPRAVEQALLSAQAREVVQMDRRQALAEERLVKDDVRHIVRVTQLPAHYFGLLRPPAIVANRTPVSVVTQLHSSFIE